MARTPTLSRRRDGLGRALPPKASSSSRLYTVPTNEDDIAVATKTRLILRHSPFLPLRERLSRCMKADSLALTQVRFLAPLNRLHAIRAPALAIWVGKLTNVRASAIRPAQNFASSRRR